jgi:hypothetical protein
MNLIFFEFTVKKRLLRRGEGYFMLGVWGCPPAYKKSPEIGGLGGW